MVYSRATPFLQNVLQSKKLPLPRLFFLLTGLLYLFVAELVLPVYEAHGKSEAPRIAIKKAKFAAAANTGPAAYHAAAAAAVDRSINAGAAQSVPCAQEAQIWLELK